jgi:hypothetical protein
VLAAHGLSLVLTLLHLWVPSIFISHDLESVVFSFVIQVNLAYVLWILFVNVQGMFLLLAATLMLPRPAEGFLTTAINANQLFVFLIVRWIP